MTTDLVRAPVPVVTELRGVLEVTPVGLRIDEGIRFNDWVAILETSLRLTDGGCWYLADCVAFGWKKLRDDPSWRIYATMIEAKYAKQSLYNVGSVARRVEISRRREILSFAHHAEVAALEPDEQDAWLDDAVSHNWSRNELRDELRKARGVQAQLPPPPRLVLSRPDRPQWQAAAERRDMSIEEWATEVLDREAALALEAA